MIITKTRAFIGFLLAFLGFALSAWAVETPSSPSWSPEEIIPPMIHLARNNADNERMGATFRAELVKSMTYWKSLGMPKPDTIEGLIDLSGADDLKVIDILQKINPEIPNVANHIENQREIYNKSILFGVLERLEKKLPKNDFLPVGNEPLTTFIFSQFVRLRYNFPVLPNAYEAIQKNWTLKEARTAIKSANVVLEDNAFFVQIPQIDLGTILTPDSGTDAEKFWQAFQSPRARAANIERLMPMVINAEALHKASMSPNFFFQNIFILPRSTQTTETPQLSTMNDFTVGIHELGHEMLDSLKEPGDQPINRLVHEVMADYFTAAPANNPVLGDYFAKISSEIIARIEAKAPLTTKDQRLIDNLSRLVQRGFIRDLSAESNMDQMARVYSSADPYAGGNPVRKALWTIRSESGLSSSEFDKVVLETATRFVALPRVFSARTQWLLWVRALLQKSRKSAQLKKIKKQVGKMSEFSADPDKMSETEAAEFAESLTYAAEKIYQEKFSALEKKKMGRRGLFNIFGVSDRPAIEADYVVPEFFRELYRVAQEHSPKLAATVRTEAERAMNGSSILVSNGTGAKDIVFLRRSLGKLNLIARPKINQRIQELAKIRQQVLDLRGKVDEDSVRLRDGLQKTYGAQLEGLQEFERTSSTFKLYKPYLLLDILARFAPTGATPVNNKCLEAINSSGI